MEIPLTPSALSAAPITGGSIAVVGVGVGIYGASVYSSSKAASEPNQTSSVAEPSPIVMAHGLRLSGRF